MAAPAASAAREAVATTTADFLGVSGSIPRLGLGLAALGRPGYINIGHSQDLTSTSREGMRAHCGLVLDEAHALGIRYFDTARSYGEAEAFLSSWLATRAHAKAPAGPASVVIGSKWGYTYTADWKVDTGGRPHEVKEHSAPNLRKQAAESKALLGSHMHLYQIHSATLESGVLENQDVLSELEHLTSSRGWRIGLSCSGVQQAETVRLAMSKVKSNGSRLFDSVQVTWNLMEQSAGEAMAEAHAAGVHVIVKEAMANGRLLRGAPLEALQAVAAQHSDVGAGPDAVALAAVLVQPFRPMVLSGATTIEQLRSNARALQLAEVLTPQEVQRLMDALRVEPAQYWSERSGMQWN